MLLNLMTNIHLYTADDHCLNMALASQKIPIVFDHLLQGKCYMGHIFVNDGKSLNAIQLRRQNVSLRVPGGEQSCIPPLQMKGDSLEKLACGLALV